LSHVCSCRAQRKQPFDLNVSVVWPEVECKRFLVIFDSWTGTKESRQTIRRGSNLELVGSSLTTTQLSASATTSEAARIRDRRLSAPFEAHESIIEAAYGSRAGSGGVGWCDHAADMVVQSDGRLVVAATSGRRSGSHNPDSTVDRGFGTDGQSTAAVGSQPLTVTAVAREPDGQFVVAGTRGDLVWPASARRGARRGVRGAGRSSWTGGREW
jgi:hypothetical protein